MAKSLLSVADLSKDEINEILDRAKELKKSIKSRQELNILKNKVVGLLFEKPSTRTRTSFEVAALRLGGSAVYLSANELQLSRGEPIKDTARILGSYLDAIVARVYSHNTVVELAKYANVPVINGLSDLEHPTQILSDMLTIIEAKGKLEGLNFVFIGDGNNMCNSWLLGSAIVGMNMTAAIPKGYYPDQKILDKALEIAKKTGSKIKIVNDPKEAAKDADILYTDVWVSMGQEKETEKRMRDFQGYQINKELLRLAKKDAVVMHCLPAHRGLEITDDVIEGEQSIVWVQAENKLYGAAAVLEYYLK
ncbi:ornithine carbamoyltransferase [Fervidicoccus fontis]|uniref:Ornithine carbamoyltransferase n=1 Tax=Fervidicoccus fontis TaxID=683846 RepID=A0A7C2VMI4_9CREN|nr:ornithine carbamoyltransferase [Fervidicoccus fontis]HEW63614.1 ornithine carbamoyltransferase [Fervidicoccus fontis]